MKKIFFAHMIFVFAFLLFFHNCKILPQANPNDIEQEIFTLINEYRSTRGLSVLIWNETIAEQCRIHSKNMGDNKIHFGHDGFEERFENIMQAIKFTVAAENVAYNYNHNKPGQTAFDNWINNQDHRANIEGNFNLTGIGVYRTDDNIFYLTQIFIKNN